MESPKLHIGRIEYHGICARVGVKVVLTSTKKIAEWHHSHAYFSEPSLDRPF